MKRRFLARFGTVAPASLLLTSPLHTVACELWRGVIRKGRVRSRVRHQ